jgi:DNA-binding response OmpR family regulator
MSQETRILLVDDDSFTRKLVEDVLGDDFNVTSIDNGKAALELAQKEFPDLILLDVEMPGLDGYETCIRFKQLESTAAIPVIFISAHDHIEERLKGYEAGGYDYVTKPFDPQELKAKISHLLSLVSERGQFKNMASYASSTAMTAMTSMSEMGILLESLKKFNASIDEKELAEAILSSMSQFGLEGAVQIRLPKNSHSITERGEASPLEVSVLNHMAGMDRITQFRNRVSIHFDHALMLVNNMPVEDTERCGRLRDHLVMLLEGAEARARGIIAENESRQRAVLIEQAVTNITKTLAEIDYAQRHGQIKTGIAINEFTDDMENAYIRVAISETQESFMSDVVKNGLEKILNTQSAEFDIQDKFTNIIKALNSLSKP